MKIGYDITLLQNKMTGVEEYEYNLLIKMSELSECYCFMGKHAGDQFNKERLNYLKSHTTGWHSFPYGRIWKNIVFPSMARLRRIDVFHIVSGDIPRAVCGRVVYTVHDLAPFRVPDKYPEVDRKELRLTLMRTINSVDQIIAVSESTKTDIIDIFDLSDERVTVVPLGVSQAFTEKNFEDLSETFLRTLTSRPFILTSGVHHRRKNFRMLLQMFMQLCDANEYDGDLVATGALGEEDRAAIEYLPLHIKKRVHVPGHVARGDLKQLYMAADLFVFPSLYEGFGLPVLEAMMCGCPVASSNASSMPEVLGDAGLYFDPLDCEQMKSVVITLLDDQALRKKFSLLGTARASEFSWHRTAVETHKVYELALGH